VTAAPGTSAPAPEPQKLYDILGIVAYMKSAGADAATPNFARGLITSGQVPHVRIGRKYYVSKSALDAWIQRHERRAR